MEQSPNPAQHPLLFLCVSYFELLSLFARMVASIPTSAERVNPIGMTINPNWLLPALEGDMASCAAYDIMAMAGAHNMSTPPIFTLLVSVIRSAPAARRMSLAASTT